MPRKVNIIGAGIAGLTAGCYLQMNGFDSEIFEAHSLPGGLCTSWKKGDYWVDGCMHWLVGSNPKYPVYHLWNEIIDMSAMRFHDHEEFFRVRDTDGREIIGYSDIGKLEKELLAKAPADRKLILEFVGSVRNILKFRMRSDKAPELYSLFDRISGIMTMMPHLRTLARYSNMTIREFAGRCKDPLLAKFFEFSFASEMPVLFIMITFSWLNNKNAGYPIGGSLNFARKIEQRYLELGGKVHYDSKVKRILVEEEGNGQREKGKEFRAKGKGQREKLLWKATGIELENGDVYNSDITISAADGYSTIFKMLEGRFVDERIRKYYDDFEVFPSFLQISLGIAADLSNRPLRVVMPLEKPLVVDPQRTIDNLFYRIYSYDPTLAPAGKTLVTCMIKTYNARYWQELRTSDGKKYMQEKKRILEFVIDNLNRELGDIREKIEMTDVSTPATVIRYTHNWKGSVEGWLITRKTGFKSMPKVLAGLKDFYMAGQWVEPGGGVPAAFFSGRNVVQVIINKYN